MTGIIQRLKAASANERALALAILAVVSALLSWGLPEPDMVIIGNTPMLPAVWFGLVLCVGVALWSSRSPLTLAVVLLASCAAWLAAFEATTHVHASIEDQIASQSGAPTPNFSVPVVNYLKGLCGMLGGLIGSGVLVVIASTVLSSIRAVPSWTRTILVGTVAGLFLEFLESRTEGGLFIHIGSLLPVFLVWQMSVAASMAYSFTKPAAATGGDGRT
jgi:hypothetical protein